MEEHNDLNSLLAKAQLLGTKHWKLPDYLVVSIKGKVLVYSENFCDTITLNKNNLTIYMTESDGFLNLQLEGYGAQMSRTTYYYCTTGLICREENSMGKNIRNNPHFIDDKKTLGFVYRANESGGFSSFAVNPFGETIDLLEINRIPDFRMVYDENRKRHSFCLKITQMEEMFLKGEYIVDLGYSRAIILVEFNDDFEVTYVNEKKKVMSTLGISRIYCKVGDKAETVQGKLPIN